MNAEEALKVAREALGKVANWSFGWDGDCGVRSFAEDALAAIEASVPPVAEAIPAQTGTGASIDTKEFRELLNDYRSWPGAYGKAHAALVAHINAYGQQQREEGFQDGLMHSHKQALAVTHALMAERDGWRERAEKAEAELEDWRHTNRIDELCRRVDRAEAALAAIDVARNMAGNDLLAGRAAVADDNQGAI